MGKRSSLKSKSGRRELNPTDAFRKQQRNREKKRNKKERHKVREEAGLRRNPALIQQELNDLKHKELLGQMDVKGRKRLEYLELLWLTVEQRMHADHNADNKLDLLGRHDDSDSASSSGSDNSDDDAPRRPHQDTHVPVPAATHVPVPLATRVPVPAVTRVAEAQGTEDIPLPTDLIPEDIPLPTDMTSTVPLPSDLQNIPLPPEMAPTAPPQQQHPPHYRPPTQMLYGGYPSVPYWMVGLPMHGRPPPQHPPEPRHSDALQGGNQQRNRYDEQYLQLRPASDSPSGAAVLNARGSGGADDDYSTSRSSRVNRESASSDPLLEVTAPQTQGTTANKVVTGNKVLSPLPAKNLKALFVPTRLRVQKPSSTGGPSSASSLSTVSSYALGADRGRESTHTLGVSSVVGMPKALTSRTKTTAAVGGTTADLDAAFASFLREVND